MTVETDISEIISSAELASSLIALTRSVRAAAIEECARIAEGCFGGKAHTYASENADLYRAQDAACALIAAKIRALAITRPNGETP